MSSEDIISKLKGDNVLAQRFHCAGCQRLIAQVPDPTLVPVKGKRRGADKTEAKGILCGDCLKNERIAKEGPRQAVWMDESGEIRVDYYDNLLDMGTEEAAPTAATEEEAAKTKKVK